MKKKIFILCSVILIVISTFLITQNRSSIKNNLFLENIEALAEDESGGDKGILMYRELSNGETEYCCCPGTEKQCGSAKCASKYC